MFADSLLIGFYWGSRAESIESCAVRTSQFLQWASRFSPYLRNFSAAPGTAAHDESLPVDSSRSAIEALLQAGLTYPDVGDTPFYDAGYNVALWNQGKNNCSISININCASIIKGIGNLCLLQIAPNTDVQRDLCQPLRLTEACRALIDIWEPESGAVTCNRLVNAVHPRAKIPDVGWYIYRRDAALPDSASSIDLRIMEVPGRGILASTTCEIAFPPSDTAISSVQWLFDIFGPAP